jgi:molybdopterin-binding protein
MQRERGMTVLQVTHDFLEAGLLGDTAIVLDAGVVIQAAPPEQLFRTPATAAVADFIGIENVFRGTITPMGRSDAPEVSSLRFEGEGIELYAVGQRTAGQGHAVFGAADVTLSTSDPSTSARNALHGVVDEIAHDGALSRVSIRVAKTSVIALITRAAEQELQLKVGDAVTATIKAMNVHLC